MDISKRKRLGIGAAVVTGATIIIGLIIAINSDPRSDYPDSPFVPVGPNFPRIVPVEEEPRQENSPAWVRYAQQRQAAYQYLAWYGAIRRASVAEAAAVRDVLGGNYVRARDRAEKILKVNARSVPALLALAEAQFQGEKNLPRALFQVGKVRRLLEARGRQYPQDTDSREWYIRALFLEYRILWHLDRPAEQLRVVDLLAQVYEDIPKLRVWPLLKLKRFREAEKCIERMIASGRWPLTSMNDLCALAAEERQRQRAYKAGAAMVKKFPRSAVLWSNHAGSAYAVFRPDEAEFCLRQSARLSDQGLLDFYGSTHRSLAGTYLQQARFAEAWEELKKGKIERDHRPPHTLEQDQGRKDSASALFFLALGYGEEAIRFGRRAHDRPDRTGFTSTDETRDALGNKVLLWTVLQNRLEQLREEDAAQTGLSGLTPDVGRRALEFETWTVRRQTLKLLGGLNRGLEFRPYMPGSAGIDVWLKGSLIQMLPPGIATVAIRQARADEDHPDAVPYLDALEAEAALARDDSTEALRLARGALAKLPEKGEKLLRGRTAAIAAEAARRLGHPGACSELLDQALNDFPEALRLLRVALPVRVETDGTPPARLLASRLLGSPRFRADSNGFRIAIRTTGGRLGFALYRLGGELHFQDDIPVKGEPDEVVAQALKRFHRKLMSPRLDLKPVDVNFLDGPASGVMVQENVDKLLKKLRD